MYKTDKCIVGTEPSQSKSSQVKLEEVKGPDGSKTPQTKPRSGKKAGERGRRKIDVLTYVITITMNAGYNVGYTKIMSVYRELGEKPP